MHIYFSGIGGTAIGPLALIAKEAGFNVSGSDKYDSSYIKELKKLGINDIHIGQTKEAIAKVHDSRPIDWLVYSSAVTMEDSHHPELEFAKSQSIKKSDRSEFISYFLSEKKLEMVAIAGTHGKTTTTAMVIWLCKQLDFPISYSLGAKNSFGNMGQYLPGSKYFVYEADEFANNFLAYKPVLSLITGVTWDHHEIFPTREDYQAAFREFIAGSQRTIIWQEDFDYLQIDSPINIVIQETDNPVIELLQQKGRYNRLDGWLAIQAVHRLTDTPIGKLVGLINSFPGISRRMEEIAKNLYSDYAHTPDKIRGGMSVAMETAAEHNQQLAIIYEPLTNRRQHYVAKEYKNSFDGASKIYWIPSYLAREDPLQPNLSPKELISHLSDPSIAEPAKMGPELKKTIKEHLDKGDLVVAMSGGGGNSLDEWLRENFKDS
ncbi:MAG TPA: Mur ligase domain-containing protein [Candidatus Saccharimonadales bacterium]|nr:Mur ligase domain-containing protein [Candidatus Saccharimonadales bacterium]